MIGGAACFMALETRVPRAAALEFNGNNVDISVIMRASGLRVDFYSPDYFTENVHKIVISTRNRQRCRRIAEINIKFPAVFPEQGTKFLTTS